MKITADGIGVDAGMIMIADINYSKEVKKFGFCKKELKRLGKTFDVPNGKYRVRWSIEETWNGSISGTEELTVTGGKIFVCDPCYPIGNDKDGEPDGDKWIDWLNYTDYGKEMNTEKAFVIDEMGGDGEYVVELSLEKV